jgi:hypothetical protein
VKVKAIEFETKIKNNRIHIPVKIQSELNIDRNKTVRVIVLFEDTDDLLFQNLAAEQFFKGYADSDAIYDSY